MVTTRTVILDCGASRTALGVFRRKAGRICLEQYAARVFAIQSGSEDNWLENTRAAFQSFRARERTNENVVLVLPAHAVLTKRIKTPLVAPAQRQKIIGFEAEQNIPYALADVVWDSIVVSESDRELEMLLAAAKLDLVEPLCVAAEEAGFHPRLVLPSLLGTLAGFRLAQPDRKECSLVLNLGTRSATLLVTEPGRFAGRTFSLGSSSATRPAAENQDSDPGETDTIKLPAHRTGPLDDAVAGLRARLFQEIARSVLHFHSQSQMLNPEKVYLTGEGAHLPGLSEALAEKLKIPVERLDLLRTIEIANKAAANEAVEHAATLTDLVGAAATQLRSKQPVLDLLPARRCKLASFRRRQSCLIAAALLLVTALVPPLVHFRTLMNDAKEETARIDRELGPLRERAARDQAKLLRLGEVRQQILGLQSVYDRRTRWVGLLADLQDRLVSVEDVWLEKLQVVSGAAGTPLRLLISGRMLDKANPLSKVSPETFSRVKTLLAGVAGSPFASAVEGTRFDNSQPGILKFDFVLVTSAERPL